MAADVLLPEGDFQPPFAVFYLLHGLSDDHTIWQRRTSIERYVENLPLIVVMPNGDRSFYIDSVSNPQAAYETAIVRDLIGFIDGRFQTRATREGRCIGGLSMGGYGAVKLALKHPDLFASAVSHSGAVAFAHKPLADDPRWQKEWLPILGENPEGGPEDCFALAEKLVPEGRPALRIDCGVEDFLLEDNRAFHTHLEQLGFPHEYAEYPGAHNWAYWDIHVQEAIAFHVRNLGLTPPARPETKL